MYRQIKKNQKCIPSKIVYTIIITSIEFMHRLYILGNYEECEHSWEWTEGHGIKNQK